MTRDELIAILIKLPNLPVVIVGNTLSTNLEEGDIEVLEYESTGEKEINLYGGY